MSRYAAKTDVSSTKSRDEIERTLTRYGADQFMYGWEDSNALIAFRKDGKHIKFILPLPSRADPAFTQYKKGYTMVERAEDAAARERVMAREDMPPRMRRFLASPRRRITEAVIRQRRTKSLRRSLKRISILKELRSEQGNRCYFCKRLMLAKTTVPEERQYVATLDHLKALSKGGDNSRENLCAACNRCNAEKGDMDAADYLAIWAERHERRRARDTQPKAGDAKQGSARE